MAGGDATGADVIGGSEHAAEVAAFVARAREYCAFIEGAAKMAPPERLRIARERLLALNADAARLPDVEAPEEVREPDGPSAPDDWEGFGELETYWEVFDAYENDEPVAGSLSDDLLDVYRDVGRGLLQWDGGEDAAAIWGWRFSFETHWGEHAVDALRALHRACARVGAV